jgi:hypothetical protein
METHESFSVRHQLQLAHRESDGFRLWEAEAAIRRPLPLQPRPSLQSRIGDSHDAPAATKVLVHTSQPVKFRPEGGGNIGKESSTAGKKILLRVCILAKGPNAETCVIQVAQEWREESPGPRFGLSSASEVSCPSVENRCTRVLFPWLE